MQLGEAILAGRQKPDDREALLLDFRHARLPPPSQLPAGRGFSVEATRHPSPHSSLALTRQQGARTDLFEAMAQDPSPRFATRFMKPWMPSSLVSALGRTSCRIPEPAT
ncbi:hypothetical protein ACFFMP_17775 [Pseudoroseomonas cervicalis]